MECGGRPSLSMSDIVNASSKFEAAMPTPLESNKQQVLDMLSSPGLSCSTVSDGSHSQSNEEVVAMEVDTKSIEVAVEANSAVATKVEVSAHENCNGQSIHLDNGEVDLNDYRALLPTPEQEIKLISDPSSHDENSPAVTHSSANDNELRLNGDFTSQIEDVNHAFHDEQLAYAPSSDPIVDSVSSEETIFDSVNQAEIENKSVGTSLNCAAEKVHSETHQEEFTPKTAVKNTEFENQEKYQEVSSGNSAQIFSWLRRCESSTPQSLRLANFARRFMALRNPSRVIPDCDHLAQISGQFDEEMMQTIVWKVTHHGSYSSAPLPSFDQYEVSRGRRRFRDQPMPPAARHLDAPYNFESHRDMMHSAPGFAPVPVYGDASSSYYQNYDGARPQCAGCESGACAASSVPHVPFRCCSRSCSRSRQAAAMYHHGQEYGSYSAVSDHHRGLPYGPADYEAEEQAVYSHADHQLHIRQHHDHQYGDDGAIPVDHDSMNLSGYHYDGCDNVIENPDGMHGAASLYHHNSAVSSASAQSHSLESSGLDILCELATHEDRRRSSQYVQQPRVDRGVFSPSYNSSGCSSGLNTPRSTSFNLNMGSAANNLIHHNATRLASSQYQNDTNTLLVGAPVEVSDSKSSARPNRKNLTVIPPSNRDLSPQLTPKPKATGSRPANQKSVDSRNYSQNAKPLVDVRNSVSRPSKKRIAGASSANQNRTKRPYISPKPAHEHENISHADSYGPHTRIVLPPQNFILNGAHQGATSGSYSHNMMPNYARSMAGYPDGHIDLDLDMASYDCNSMNNMMLNDHHRKQHGELSNGDNDLSSMADSPLMGSSSSDLGRSASSSSSQSSASSTSTSLSVANSRAVPSIHQRYAQNIAPGVAGPHPPRICTNCNTTNTPSWRFDDAGLLQCNACALYSKLNGKKRPVNLFHHPRPRRKKNRNAL